MAKKLRPYADSNWLLFTKVFHSQKWLKICARVDMWPLC